MDLPLPHGAGPMLRSRLLAAGVTEDEVRRWRRSGELTSIARGAYMTPGDPRLDDAVARHALLVDAALPRISDDAVTSHVSAAVLHGLPIWNLPLDRVVVTRPRRSGGLRTTRLHVHTAPLDPGEITAVGDVATTSPARTVVDLARAVPFEQAVVVADAALHRHLVSSAALAAAVVRATGWPGAPQARRVVEFADARSESPGESRSRVAIARAGLATPVPQWQVLLGDGRVVETDFGWPDLRTVGEFDGRVKYGRLLRPAQEPGEAVFAEKVREDAVRATGLHVARWTWRELDDFAPVARRILGG